MENYLNLDGLTASRGLGIFLTTLIFVLLAEMGDKTQLLVMAFAARYKLRQVVVGVVLSIFVLNILAVLAGSAVTTFIPINYIQILASISFIVFGIIAFRDDEEQKEKDKTIRISATLTVAVSFFIAELGDKTQLATMAFAAKYGMPLQVLAGSVIAMVIADTLGLLVGTAVHKYIPQKYIKAISGLMFIGFGFVGLGSLIPQEQITKMSQYVVLIVGLIALLAILFIEVMSINVKRKGKKS